VGFGKDHSEASRNSIVEGCILSAKVDACVNPMTIGVSRTKSGRRGYFVCR